MTKIDLIQWIAILLLGISFLVQCKLILNYRKVLDSAVLLILDIIEKDKE